MKYYITIDTGTSNTRTYLWDAGRKMAVSAKAEVGVHVTAMDGNNSRLKAAIRGCLEELLNTAGITYADVAGVMASGMITSNVGLVEVPHALAPAGREELAQQCVLHSVPDVCPLPILFVPGVKNALPKVDGENFEAMDMMRGEEVETLAILEAFPAGQEYLLVLPGSHTKFVRVDSQGRITGCLTTITGELLDCITNHTVIADSVGRSFATEETYDREMVLKGYAASAKTGLGRAAFSARILNTFAEKDKGKIASFILGAALASDVQSLHNSSALHVSPETTVIVSGKNPLRRAIVDILELDGTFAGVREYIPQAGMPLSAAGVFRVLDTVNRRS